MLSGNRRSSRVAAAAVAAAATPPALAAAPPAPKKRRAASQTNSPRNTKRTGLTSAVSRAGTTEAAVGVIDPECSVTAGSIIDLDGAPCDAMLVLVDPAQNMDKFFILQLIKDGTTDEAYMVYTRWGRTGTKGQALEQEFDDLENAVACFRAKFRQKTDLEWEDRHAEADDAGNKYRFVVQDFDQKKAGYTGAVWQYWVDDGVDGKANGWYDYDDAGSRQAERLFVEHSGTSGLATRIVESGQYSYEVNLLTMTQTNTSTAKGRGIRRVVAGANVDDGDDDDDDDGDDVKMAATPAPSTPNRKTKSKPAVVTPNAATLTPATPPAATVAQKPKSHPVDADIAVVGRNPADYKVVQFGSNDLWYDCVLNQCNIGHNNNKYHRIQMLEEKKGVYFVWCKWGRVGEAARSTSSSWLGPFDSKTTARSAFTKKYTDKTGNPFGTQAFVEKTGKYVPVEVDNDVQVSNPTAVSSNAKQVKYMDSVLDPKTKELVEVLFSEEMRSEALTSFNLDLKRLPLGVPSKAQIDHGISILREIEDKLNGTSVGSESFQDLSSRFYTAIPHSFGRTVPPTIDTATSLQGRYDMCNILLDMYDTTETVRRIEAENRVAAKALAPNPVDQYYQSLNADLTLVKGGSKEDKTIRKYFEETKSSYSPSQLLNIWSVHRQGEPERFAAFDKIGNRHLLWHGTNIAVVAPIVTTGLRIMPHSGGRVGAGIYLACMQEKSAQYMSGYGSKFACMFLCEAPLGKQHLVHEDGPHASGLRKAPKGFDSVRAVGTVQPQKTVALKIDDKDLLVPASKAAQSGVQSSFTHDEFLVYDEAQVRLRYIVTVKV
jgi:poly [ADP-ribose] polymerase 2/3/4